MPMKTLLALLMLSTVAGCGKTMKYPGIPITPRAKYVVANHCSIKQSERGQSRLNESGDIGRISGFAQYQCSGIDTWVTIFDFEWSKP